MNPDKVLAQAYRDDDQSPSGDHLYTSETPDSAILQLESEQDPEGHAARYKSISDKINAEKAASDAKGEADYNAQNPTAHTANMLAAPGQWFQSNIVKPIVSGITDAVGPVPLVQPLFDLGKGISAYGRNMSDSADNYIAQGKDITSIRDSNGNISQHRNPLYQATRDIGDAIQEFNPIPGSTGEAVAGAAMAGAISTPEILGDKLAAMTPEAVEGGFNKLAKVIPRANQGFLEANLAKAEVEKQLGTEQSQANEIDAARERDLSTKARVSLAIQTREGQNKMNNDWAQAAQRNLTGSEYSIPQLPQAEVGQRIAASLSPLNPYSKIATDLAPIVADRKQVTAQLANPMLSVPVNSVQDALAGVKDDLIGLVNTPGETSAARTLAPYLKLPEWQNTQIPSKILGKSGEFVSSPTSVSAGTVHSDAANLGELAQRKMATDPKAAKALQDAQGILQQAVTDNVPPKVGQSVIQNRRDFGGWYDTHHNDVIEGIRQAITDPKFANGSDPIFASQASVDAYKAAVTPEDWNYVRKNKINEVVGKILNSDDPKGTLEGMKTNMPGFLESFTNEHERNMLDSIATNKHEVSIGKQDLEGLYKIREGIEDKTRRQGDGTTPDPTIRSAQSPAGTMVDKTPYARNILMGAEGMGILMLVAEHHPYVAGALGAVGVAGFGPELMGRLYLKSPEVRSLILDAGAAKDHIGAVRATAQLSALLEAKADQIDAHNKQTGENRKPLPQSLKKFALPSGPSNAGVLPSDVEASPINPEHYQPGFTGTLQDKGSESDGDD